MAFWKKTIRDWDVSNKRILLRVDYNVPLDEAGNITDDYRIEKSLDTINYLLEKNCSLVICSHLGRPKQAGDPSASLKPVAKRLGELLDREVQFVPDCVGEEVKKKASSLQSGDILVLENLRYHEEEEANDEAFGAELAALGELFVCDAFGAVHRAHASLIQPPRHMPGLAGLLLEREVDTITKTMEQPERPVMAVIGGAKISDKIEAIHRFMDIADVVVVGGAMANTFLLAQGIKLGKSLVDKDDLPLANEIIEKARTTAASRPFVFYIPQDGIVAKNVDNKSKTRIVDWNTHTIADIEAYPGRPKKESMELEQDERVLDIGPFSSAFIAGAMQLSKTVIWNGAMGVTEVNGLQGPVGPFAHGTQTIVDAMTGVFGNKPFTVVGGGDTVGYIEDHKLVANFGHVSTGGGASMELMSGKSLPGVEALWH